MKTPGSVKVGVSKVVVTESAREVTTGSLTGSPVNDKGVEM